MLCGMIIRKLNKEAKDMGQLPNIWLAQGFKNIKGWKDESAVKSAHTLRDHTSVVSTTQVRQQTDVCGF